MQSKLDVHPEIYNQLVSHFNQLKINYSKLLNVRVDFHYGANQPVNINKAYQDIVYLYHQFKLTYEGVIGCQFVLEFSSVGQLHIHTLFFINGQKHQKYFPFYQWLNDYWIFVTQGFGHTFDCNKTDSYQNSIIDGVKTYQDDNYDKGITHLIRYFAKQDQKIDIPSFYRCFTSLVQEKSNRGRTRSKPNSILPYYPV